MNVKSLALLLGVGIATVGLTPTLAAAAVDGWTVRGVSQRAGPGPEYPRIGFVPGGVHVRIFGCIHSLRSCDISWRGNRGWVNGNALAGLYRGRRVSLVTFGVQIGVPFIGFDFAYWDRHYHKKPWFKDRDRWWADKDGDKNWDKDWQKKQGDWDRMSNRAWDQDWDKKQAFDGNYDGGPKGPGPQRDKNCKPGSDDPACQPRM